MIENAIVLYPCLAYKRIARKRMRGSRIECAIVVNVREQIFTIVSAN